MNPLLIFPFNGNGIEALACLGEQYRLLGFIDDTPEKQGRQFDKFDVYPRGFMKQQAGAKILAVPGSPKTFLQRKEIIDGLGICDDAYATVIHSSAQISPLARIGKNVLIMAGVVVTSNAVIYDHVCVLPNTVIHHDVIIGSYTMIGSNVVIAGNTKVGRNVYIGSGTNIINQIEIGDHALLGMGTNVIQSISAGATVVGNPARSI